MSDDNAVNQPDVETTYEFKSTRELSNKEITEILGLIGIKCTPQMFDRLSITLKNQFKRT